MEPVSFTMLGKRWRLRWVSRLSLNGDKLLGLCDIEKKTISVRKDLPPLAELDTILHELTHAGHEYLSEDAVEYSTTDAAKLLWKLGYRRTTKEQRKTLGID